jgi:MFS family permease
MACTTWKHPGMVRVWCLHLCGTLDCREFLRRFFVGSMARLRSYLRCKAIADRCGRALSATLSLGAMMVATVAQGCLPGKHLGGDFCLGLVVLIMCRVLQGLSAGGEIGAVVAYLMEASPVGSVGMAVSMIGVGGQISGCSPVPWWHFYTKA